MFQTLGDRLHCYCISNTTGLRVQHDSGWTMLAAATRAYPLPVTMQTDFPEDDIASIQNVTSAEICWRLCYILPRCNVATLNGHQDTCWLKHKDTTKPLNAVRPRPGVTSYVFPDTP